MSLISQIYNVGKFEMFKDVSLEQVIEMNKELINRAKDENNAKFNKFKDEVDAKIKNFEAVKYEAITERGIELKQEMDVRLELEEEKLLESTGEYLNRLKQDVKDFSKTMLAALANEEEQLIPKWNAEKEKAMGPAKQAAFEKLTSMGLTPNNPSAFYPALNDFKNNFENKWDGILKKKQRDLQIKKEQIDKQIEEMEEDYMVKAANIDIPLEKEKLKVKYANELNSNKQLLQTQVETEILNFKESSLFSVKEFRRKLDENLQELKMRLFNEANANVKVDEDIIDNNVDTDTDYGTSEPERTSEEQEKEKNIIEKMKKIKEELEEKVDNDAKKITDEIQSGLDDAKKELKSSSSIPTVLMLVALVAVIGIVGIYIFLGL